MDCEENRDAARKLVEMRDVSVGRTEGAGLEAINWTVSEGQHWGILGDSGSGKSLLIDALTRRVHVSAGTISYFLDSTAHPVPFPSPGAISIFSTEDCRRFLAGRLGYVQARWESSAQRQAPIVRHFLDAGADAKLIGMFRLDHVLDHPIITLSSGEFRKFMLARALRGAPRLLVLEDPFSGLDLESAAEFRNLLESLCRQQRPVLVVAVARPDHLLEGLTHLVFAENHRIERIGPSWIAGKTDTTRREPFDPGHRNAIRQIRGLGQPAAQPIVEMRDVSVRYGDAIILQGINWTVHEGENWAILGPNGAGKSTLLSLVTADNPQAYMNEIRLFGRLRGSGETIWDIKRQIGFISPELQFCYPPEATALEVVCSGLFDSIGLYRTCSAEEQAQANGWLETLGTESVVSRPFWSLSAGEQRLVLLARGLVKQPRLLVLDEPCLGLDASHVARFLEQLENLCSSRPTTVLYVTHRSEELPSTISHVLHLERGRVRSVEPV